MSNVRKMQIKLFGIQATIVSQCVNTVALLTER